MNTFSLINANDYTIHKYPAYAPITWTLVSSSVGIETTYPSDLTGAITINHALTGSADTNVDTGIIKNVLHKSIKHLFYNNFTAFISQSRTVTSSIISNKEQFYVISVGQNFYGESIQPGTFELQLSGTVSNVLDDSYGNLVVSSSGNGYYVGNIFYDKGIAVIAENTASIASNISIDGIKIVSASSIDIVYRSNLLIERHQINIKLSPSEFNFSPFNPTTLK